MQIVCRTCKNCHQKFKRPLKDITKKKTKNAGKFCSTKCSSLFKIVKQDVKCKQCFAHFKKLPSQIKKTKNNFCNSSCAAIYNNCHKTKGNRRSKLEKYIEKRIRHVFPLLKFKCNNRTAIEMELDFFFPKLDLAIEINGIFHRKPIYGLKKLKSTQKNDKRKKQLCRKEKIKLIVLEDLSSKFNYKDASKMWNKIAKIISQNYEAQ